METSIVPCEFQVNACRSVFAECHAGVDRETRTAKRGLGFSLKSFLGIKFLTVLLISAVLMATLRPATANTDTAASPTPAAHVEKPVASPDAASPSSAEEFKLPRWPLAPLSVENRTARLNFFSNRYDFHIAHFNKGEPETCKALLGKVKSGGFKILKPTEVRRDQTSRAQTRQMKTTCENLSPIRLYAPLSGDMKTFVSKPEFMELTEREKAQTAPMYFEAAADNEYYDLSEFLGADMWGYIGGGAVAYCRADKKSYCDKYLHRADAPYYAYLGSVIATANTKTCQVSYYVPAVYNQRLSMSSNGDIAGYEVLPSFSAFAEIDGKAYLINFRALVTWDDFGRLADSKGYAELGITTMASDSYDEKNSCGFNTDQK